MGSQGGERESAGALPLGFSALILATAVIALGACGGDDDDGGGDVSLAELRSHLPAADELGLRLQRESEWDNAPDLINQGLVIPEADLPPSEPVAAIDEAGLEGAVGSELEA